MQSLEYITFRATMKLSNDNLTIVLIVLLNIILVDLNTQLLIVEDIFVVNFLTKSLKIFKFRILV